MIVFSSFYRLPGHSIPQSLDSKVVSRSRLFGSKTRRESEALLPFACSSSRLVDPPSWCRPCQLDQDLTCLPTILANLAFPLPPPPDSLTGPSRTMCTFRAKEVEGRRFCKRIAQRCKVVLQLVPGGKVLRKVRIVGLAVAGRLVPSCNAVVAVALQRLERTRPAKVTQPIQPAETSCCSSLAPVRAS